MVMPRMAVVAAQLPANTSLAAHHPWLPLNILPSILLILLILTSTDSSFTGMFIKVSQ